MLKKLLPTYVKAYDPWCAVFFVDPIVIPLVPVLAAWRVHPNVITIFSIICTITGGVLFAFGHWLWAAAAFLVTFYLDALDGKLARFRKITSALGARLDNWADYLRKPAAYLGVGIYFYVHIHYFFAFLACLILVVHWVVHRLHGVLGVYHCDLEFPDFHRKVVRRFAPRVVALYTYFDKFFIMFVVVPVIAFCVGLPDGAILFLWGAVIAIALCVVKLIILWNYRRRGLYNLVHQEWGSPQFDFPHRS